MSANSQMDVTNTFILQRAQTPSSMSKMASFMKLSVEKVKDMRPSWKVARKEEHRRAALTTEHACTQWAT